MMPHRCAQNVNTFIADHTREYSADILLIAVPNLQRAEEQDSESNEHRDSSLDRFSSSML
jgi:hypothetical protein